MTSNTMATTPIHLVGNNAPVGEEVTLSEQALEVVGALPADLVGTFLRNGPNPRTGWSTHLFAGDGMVHGVALAAGRAGWYRNRYVRTPLYQHPGTARVDLAFDKATRGIDYRVTTANTNVVEHAGRILALEEGGFPYELTPGLDTVGPFTFGDTLRTPMTAHPKRCPITGDLLFFGYELRPPYVTLYRSTSEGTLAWSTTVDLPQPTMMHDFAITATSVVIMDSPFVFDPAAIATSGSPWTWSDGHGARFGLLPRDGDGGLVRWFDVETCHLSHVANAYDDGDEVVITGTRLVDGGLPRLHEWRLDRPSGIAHERPLDDVDTEYPRIADDAVGLPNRYAYASSFAYEAEPDHSEVYKYDLVRGSRTTHRLPAGATCGEPVFVRRDAASEDAGYLLTFVHDRSRDTSSLLVLDARDLTSAPLAEVRMPVRIPGGFHGSWLPSQ